VTVFSTDITASNKDNRHSGDADAFVATFSPDLSRLLFFSYIGRTSTDYGRELHVDVQGNTYVAGESESESFPATIAGFDKFNGGTQDGFLDVLISAGADIPKRQCGVTMSQSCR